MAEATLYDSAAMRHFAGIELGDDRIPDETTILNFRHLLERHGLTEAIFADVNAHLADKGITLRSGTLVDATIIDAPSSTKNQAGARDPEMSSTKKGNDWYFGMKAHIGVDADSGVTHSLDTSTGCCQTNANSSQFPSLGNLLGRKKAAPLCESGGAVGLKIVSTVECALLIEMIMDRRVDGCELLQCPHPTKPEHRPLSSSKGLVRVFCSIVGPTIGFLAVVDAKFF